MTDCLTVSNPCTNPVPDGYMCLTIKNISKEQLDIIQLIAPGIQPMCFSVPTGQSVSVQVNINTAWKVVGHTSGHVFGPPLSPGVSQYTAVIDGYIPAPILAGGRKEIKDNTFFGLASAFAILGLVGYFIIKQQWKPTAEYTQCMTVSSQDVCSRLHPQARPFTTFFNLCLLAALVIGVAWLLFKGPLGKTLAKEPKHPVNYSQCTARGEAWSWTEPSSNDGVSGWRLKLRQLRCRFGGDNGPCVCQNEQDRYNCLIAAYSPGAPDGLSWQSDLANEEIAPSPTSPPGYVCACCTDAKGTQCYDVANPNPLSNPCYPNV